MKKLISIIFVVVLLVGCSPKAEPVFAETGEDVLVIDETPSFTPELTIPPTPTPMPTLAPRDNLDFRNAKWGDTPEIVIAYETADFFYPDMEPALEGNSLVYNGKIADLDTHIIYIFDPNKGLYQGLYGVQTKHTTNHFYITDYGKLKSIMIEKYGKPTEDEIITLDSAASYTTEGRALEYGFTAYRTKWETDNTEIMLGMSGDNYDIGIIIQYISKNIIPDKDTSGF